MIGRTNSVLFATTLLLGCSLVAGAAGSSSQAAATVAVTVGNGKLVFKPATLTAGKVTFVVVNKGRQTHGFAVMGRGLLKRTAAIPPGKSARLTVVLKAQTYHFWDPVRSSMAKAVYKTVKAGPVSVKVTAKGKLTFGMKPPLPAGSVTFVVTNMGRQTHALAVMGPGLLKRTSPIKPGKSAKLTVTLKAGTMYHFWDPIRSSMAKAIYLKTQGASSSSGKSSSGGSSGGSGGGGLIDSGGGGSDSGDGGTGNEEHCAAVPEHCE